MALTLELSALERNDSTQIIFKKCIKCNENKFIKCFYTKSDSKDGYTKRCKDCIRDSYREDYKRRPEYYKNKEKLKYEKHPSLARRMQLKQNYNITLEYYNELFLKQNGCCAICTKHQNEFKRPLSVDHCHITNKIRGLLCVNCNSAIGLFKENEENMYKAINYLNINKL
jgi:hypothetical protein